MKKKIIAFTAILMLMAALISCSSEKLNGTYICVDTYAQVTKIVFDGKEARVTDMGMVIPCMYEIQDGKLHMSGQFEYDYEIEFDGDSIYLNGVEYNRTGKKSEDTITSKASNKENTEDNDELQTDFLTDIDLFDGFSLVYTGIDTYGIANFDISECDPFVQKNVKFTFDGTSLKNGDEIIVTALYDPNVFEKNNYKVLTDTMKFQVYGLQEIKYFDPFDKLVVQYSGISPYCSVAINDSQCSTEVQTYVKTELPDKLKNGETFIVKRYIDNDITEKYGIALTETEKEYTMSDMPEFLESLDDVDLSYIEDELADFIIAQTAANVNTSKILGIYLYRCLVGYPYSTSWSMPLNDIDISTELVSEYFRVRKLTYQDEFTWGNNNRFNSIYYFYQINVNVTEYDNSSYSGKYYAIFEVPNLIKYPDGSIKWGYNSSNDMDFYGIGNLRYEDLEADWIDGVRDDYNIVQIYGN